MINKNPIYTITCITKLECDHLGWPDFGAVSFQGFYHEKDAAIESVKTNNCDIAERCYDFAIVEEISPGLYTYPRPRWFFKYDVKNNTYEEIDEPRFMKNIANVL